MRVQVYPEYYDGELKGDGVEIYGKLTNESKSRMFLSVDGVVKFSYDKMRSDGRNKAGDPNQIIDVFVDSETAIGLVCCKDVDDQSLLDKVKEKLDASGAANKIICISACMSDARWFYGKTLPLPYHNYIVVLSNGNPTGIESFIANVGGNKLERLRMDKGSLSIINNGLA